MNAGRKRKPKKISPARLDIRRLEFDEWNMGHIEQKGISACSWATRFSLIYRARSQSTVRRPVGYTPHDRQIEHERRVDRSD